MQSTTVEMDRHPSGGPLFTRDFLLNSLTSFTVFAGFMIMVPAIPIHMKSLGALDSDIGLALSAFSFMAVLSRIVAGPILDVWGRKWPLVAGAAMCVVSVALYEAAFTVPAMLGVRLLHGAAFGVLTAACGVLAADLAPSDRRGEALGYFALFGSVSTAIAPTLAVLLYAFSGMPLSGFRLVVAGSVVIALIGVLTSLFIGQPRTDSPRSGRRGLSSVGLSSVYSRGVVPLFVTSALQSVGLAAVFSFMAVYTAGEGSGNAGIFFMVYAAVMMLSRPMAGRLSDRKGRPAVIIAVSLSCCVGIGALIISPSLPVGVVSAVFCGLGFGGLQPALLALAVDRVPPEERAAATSMLISAVDLGMALTSPFLGMVANSYGYPPVFAVSACCSVLGLAFFILFNRATHIKPAV